MERFYLTQNGKPVGPWSLDDIMKNLKSEKIAWTDYLYDEDKQDWVLLMDHPKLSPQFKQGQADPKTEAPAPIEPNRDKEWFVLKGENKYGPFPVLELVKMLQEKELYEYDYIWNERFSSWKRVAECEEFKPERIRGLRDSGHPEIEEVFFRRRHVRAQYGASLVVHNNKNVWRAESIEISPGGCGLRVENATLEPGQNLFLHFKAGDGVPPFNAICQVVSRQSAHPGQTWVKYGVKFTSISRQIQLAIKEFTGKAA